MSGVALVEHGNLLGFFPEVSIGPQLATGALRRVTGVPGLPHFELQVVAPRTSALKPAASRLVELVKQVLTERIQSASS
jgi:DNA-binding transcriptional LysR family regulator